MNQIISILPRIVSGIGLLLSMPAFPAYALQADHKELGSAADWRAYAYRAPDGRPMCALSSQPVAMRAQSHRKAFFIITRAGRMAGKPAYHEIALDIGQALAPEKQAELRIAQTKFLFFSGATRSGFEARWAWPLNRADEPRIISIMKAGYDMEISAELENGETIRDLYSLKGVTGGMALLAKNCP